MLAFETVSQIGLLEELSQFPIMLKDNRQQAICAQVIERGQPPHITVNDACSPELAILLVCEKLY
jgi:hypothetical protein